MLLGDCMYGSIEAYWGAYREKDRDIDFPAVAYIATYKALEERQGEFEGRTRARVV